MKLRLRFIAALCALATALPAAGQGVDGLPVTVSLSNPALLDSFEGRTGTVSLKAQKENGGLISLEESPDSYLAGARAEAWNRVGPRLTFHGKLHWQYFHGNNMGGQILMDPSYNPVNFLESTEDTKGAKHRERYALDGGLSYRLGQRWALGFSVSYQAADQTKVKDPRFSNIWMDLNLKAGLSWKPGNLWTFGASLNFRNTLEQLKGGIYGTTDKQYNIATDKGAFIGTTDGLAGDYNAISVENYRPMMNYLYGGAIQAVCGQAYAGELWFMLRSGYYGRKSDTTPTIYEFGGFQAGYTGSWRWGGEVNRHRLGLHAFFESLSNIENLYDWVPLSPGSTTRIVKYKGQEPRLSRLQARARLDYRWDKGPKLSLGARLNARFLNQNASVYPRTRHQLLVSVGADIYGIRRFPAGKTFLDVELHALASGGGGEPAGDWIDPMASSTSVKSYDNYLYRQWEWDTAPRAGACAALTWRLPAWGKVFPYVRVSEEYLHLLNSPQYLDGAARNVAVIGVGLHF